MWNSQDILQERKQTIVHLYWIPYKYLYNVSNDKKEIDPYATKDK